MKYRKRIYYTETDKAPMWDRGLASWEVQKNRLIINLDLDGVEFEECIFCT